jgi:serine/threonine protein kinase
VTFNEEAAGWSPDTQAVRGGLDRTQFQETTEPIFLNSGFVYESAAAAERAFTGERAFKGKTAVDTMSAILKEDPADFPPAIHASAPAIERIVRRCLEKNADERFQSVRDVAFALEALSSASGINRAGRRTRRLPLAPARRRRGRRPSGGKDR